MRRNAQITPVALGADLEQLFLRYYDLVTSQTDALEAGDLPRATRIAAVAEGVLLDCQRLMHAIPRGNTALHRKIEKLVSTAATSATDLGDRLRTHRAQLLAEIRSIETHAVGPSFSGTGLPRPSLINIKT